MNSLTRNPGSVELNPINPHHQININIPGGSHMQSSLLNLPREDLLASGEDFNAICVPLHKASTTGDLEAAKVILDNRPELVRFSITKSCETMLHVAVSGKSPLFVQYLMSLMTKEDLELRNRKGETAFYLAARTGNVEIAKILVEEDVGLMVIPDTQGRTPLEVAALFGRKYMVEYLYESDKRNGDLWTNQNPRWVLEKCVEADLFGVALQMVNDTPNLAINGSLLRLLAQKRYALDAVRSRASRRRVANSRSFRDAVIGAKKVLKVSKISIFSILEMLKAFYHDEDSYSEKEALQLLRNILKEIMKLPKAEIDVIIRGPPDEIEEDEEQTPLEQETVQLPRTMSKKFTGITSQNFFNQFERSTVYAKKKYSSRVLFLAAEIGNTAFVLEVIQHNPDLAVEINDENLSLFHVAVSYRQEEIFDILYKEDHIRDLVITLEDENSNNMLHLVGENAKGNRLPNISGLGLRSEVERKWFKKVEMMLPSHLHRKKNKLGLTPYELFVKTHKDLFSEEENLMKELATRLMVVAALVTTISFGALVTFPGGYNQNTGIPIFLHKNLSTAFIILDSFSFLFSATAILLLISIIMSNHDAHDFMTSLPDDFITSLPGKIKVCLLLVFYSITFIVATFLISLFILYQNNSKWTPIAISMFAYLPYVGFGIATGWFQRLQDLHEFIHKYVMKFI